MARKPNYNFEKHQKEQARAKKKEAKRLEREARRAAGGGDVEGDPDLEGIVAGPQAFDAFGEPIVPPADDEDEPVVE